MTPEIFPHAVADYIKIILDACVVTRPYPGSQANYDHMVKTLQKTPLLPEMAPVMLLAYQQGEHPRVVAEFLVSRFAIVAGKILREERNAVRLPDQP